MSGEWDFYFCTIEERPASVMVDLEAATRAPDPARGWLLSVQVPMRTPRPDGLSSADEATDLRVLEEQIDAELSAVCGAEQVGRLTWDGQREIFYYARSEEGVEEALRRAVAAVPGYEGLAWRAEEDAAWSHYREFLHPGPDEMQWIKDRRVVDELRSHGDQLDLPRPVDHYAFFQQKASRDAFLAAAAEQGFVGRPAGAEAEGAPAEGGEGEAGASQDGRFGAHLVRPDPVEMGHIHDVTCALSVLAESHGGRYDGWGCPVRRAVGHG
ncbi:DUF695 domain-containing protein [Chondromyces crocatus]|uniref:Uncharacterized protein n=1 Tax=Chondromyces crocatus TaxID=52 RepID=A0A0K1ECQ6_CHOCO|nr:DUF695 domain-containing protein [Chondromyces crocatus]AKT38482.1 uncharacterized protein CMC5_026290 [Chondromyces crocatus]